MTATIHNTGDAEGRSVVTIFPQAVFDDIDAATHRRVHGDLADKGGVVTDTAGADSREPFDRGVLVRHAEFRDAQARTKLMAFLADPLPDARVWDDWMAVTEQGASMPLRYVLNGAWGSNVLRAAAAHLHRFLVRGVLRDWYVEAGIEPDITEEELDALLDAVLALLMPRWVRTPLQPFDPKGHFRHI